MTSLLQFPLFTSGEQTGRVAFSHDLIAQALAARAYLKNVELGRPGVFDRLSRRVDLGDPTLLRFMASRISSEIEANLVESLRSRQVGEAGFPVAISVLLLTRPDRDLIRASQISFSGHNLSGVIFDNRDLSGLDFRNSNLSNVVFRECDLCGASFEDAYLNRTRFFRSELRRATFGNLGRVRSIVIGSTDVHDIQRVRNWIAEQTGVEPVPVGDPCPTALQIKHTFSKFVTPLGTPRRDQLGEKGLHAGKRVEGAASSEACLQEIVRAEYLVGPDMRKRYRRPDGYRYAEIVDIVKDNKLSDGIGGLVAKLCSRRGCLHQI